MTNYQKMEISVDLRPKTPFLKIDGNVMLYPTIENVILEKAIPQGINEKILILNLKYKIISDAMKGVLYSFSYNEMLITGRQYDAVTIIHENFDDQTFEIKFIE